jgi:hypothetical protein
MEAAPLAGQERHAGRVCDRRVIATSVIPAEAGIQGSR